MSAHICRIGCKIHCQRSLRTFTTESPKEQILTGPSSPRVALAVESHEMPVRCRAQALNALRVCGLLTAVIILCGPAASAQDSVSFVRRSDVPTPRVTDIAVVRQQRVDIPSPTLLADPERSRVLQLDLFVALVHESPRPAESSDGPSRDLLGGTEPTTTLRG